MPLPLFYTSDLMAQSFGEMSGASVYPEMILFE